MKKILIVVAVVVVLGLIAIQFVPVDRDNPPVTADLQAPSAVREILSRSCYDCHSNETNWPWYSYVAPVSWYISEDVSEGRRHLNFSEWGEFSMKSQEQRLRAVWRIIVEHETPVDEHLFMYRKVRLSSDEKVTIAMWITATCDTLKSDDGADDEPDMERDEDH